MIKQNKWTLVIIREIRITVLIQEVDRKINMDQTLEREVYIMRMVDIKVR